VRIAYLTSIYAGTSSSFVRGEVFALRRRGHEVFTFSIRRPAPAEVVGEEITREHQNTEHLLAAGPPTLLKALGWWALRRPARLARCLSLATKLSNPGVRGRLLPFAYLAEGALLGRRLVELRIDHLHNHFAEGSAAAALYASTLTDVPYSFTVHGPDEFDLERAARLGLATKAAAAKFVAAITEYARSQIYRWIDIEDWPKVQIVHCGVDPSFLATPTSEPGGNRLITVGRMVEQKGQMMLIEALARARDAGADFELVVIGDGPLRGALERRIAELRLGDVVDLQGWQDSRHVAREVDAALALVLPSFAEGLPIVLMEAMARIRPVVATRVGGIRELVEPGVNGWLVAPSSIEELTEALVELARTDRQRLAAMGKAGRAAVAERHDRDVEAGKLEALMGAAPPRGDRAA
jgi:colanic acid/amylovoran biosynthesis glycosyltransferase